jgi:hypothetical protein
MYATSSRTGDRDCKRVSFKNGIVREQAGASIAADVKLLRWIVARNFTASDATIS